MNSIAYKRDMAIFLTGLVIIVLLILFAFRNFSREAFTYTSKVGRARLNEFSWQSRDTLFNEFHSAEQYVHATAAAFSRFDDIYSLEALDMLRSLFHNFSRLWLVKPDGSGRSPYLSAENLEAEPYFADLMAGRNGVSERTESFHNGTDVFCVYAPIPGGKGGVVGVYEIRDLILRTQKRRFSGTAVTNIIRTDGEYVLRSNNPYNTIHVDNFLGLLRETEMLDGATPGQVADKFERWGDGVVRFVHKGENHVASYQPLGINKWYLLTTTPEKSMEADSQAIDRMAAKLVGQVLGCLGLLIAGILYFGNKSRNAILQANRLLDINNRRFRVAAFQLSNDVVEYDVKKDVVYRVNEDVEESKPIENLADGLIRNEHIKDDYVAVLRESMEHIRDGKPYESCVVKTERSDGAHGWYKVVFTGLVDGGRQPVKAVGTIEDVTRQRDTEIRFSLEEQQRRAMLSEAVESFVFNITKERVLYGYDHNHVQTQLRASPDYGRELKAIVADRIHPDSQEAALRELSAKNLRGAFKAGRKRIELDLRAADQEDGTQRWYNWLVNLVQDPETRDLMGYAYLRDITGNKMRQLALQHEAERDPLTGLYNRMTTDRLIDDFLADPAALVSGLSAFLLIDLDRFKYVNDNYGHGSGDEVLMGMADKLKHIVRKSDIVGRMGGDEFVVFLKNFKDLDMIRKRADEICVSLKEISFAADPDYRVTGSVGVAIVPPEKASLAELYKCADLALYAAKNRGKDQYALYEPTMQHRSERH